MPSLTFYKQCLVLDLGDSGVELSEHRSGMQSYHHHFDSTDNIIGHVRAWLNAHMTTPPSAPEATDEP